MNMGVAFGELQVDQPERVFAVVEQDQPFGPKRGHLARKFAADRAAGTGDDDPLPWISRAMPSRSSGTWARFSRSSIAIGRRIKGRGRSGVAAGSSEVGRGARRICMPCSACSTKRASDCPHRSGVVTTSVSGSLSLGDQAFQHCGGILDRA